MANLVISGAGAAVGAMVGGPTGAQIGWMLGSAIATSRTEIDQRTKLGDMLQQTAQWGEPIPYIFGMQRVAGNIIWASEKKEYAIKKRQGKGGPKIVTSGFTISFAVALCAGPILGVSRVWANEKLIVDSSTTVQNLPGILYLGGLDQMPDPTMEAALGSGNVPAYRGTAYIVFRDFDITSYGAVVPSLSFEVVRGADI